MSKLIIESVHELTNDQVQTIRDHLNAAKAEVVVKVNPSLIAGIKITYQNKVLDTSLKHQLSQLYDQLI